MSDKPDICIYHGNCADGFTAAWAVWKRFGDSVQYVPGTYGAPPPDVTGKNVVLVDFSYKFDVLQKMGAQAKSLLVLDHHKTAEVELRLLPTVSSLGEFSEIKGMCAFNGTPHWAALFDMTRSGAGIAWDFFHPEDARPQLIAYVQDRDLWKFELPNSRAVNAFVFAHEYTFENWERLYQTPFRDIVMAGEAIEKKHHKDIAELVAALKRDMVIGGYRVPVANLPYTLTSDAAHLMCNQWNADFFEDGITARFPPFAACYWETPAGRVFSLRSDDKVLGSIDVSQIAKAYGGGGHKNAAGFTMPLGWEGEGL